jgi:hypothetical protein
LQVVTCTDSDVIPSAVGDVIDALELQQAVDVGQPSLDTGVLAMAMVDRAAEGARDRDLRREVQRARPTAVAVRDLHAGTCDGGPPVLGSADA